jgi:chromosome partitioning protein
MVKDDANLNGVRESLILKRALAPLREKYDYIVIDHNPGLDGILNNVQTAADEIIIPMQADLFSVEGAADMAERISSIQDLTNPNLRVAGVLITFDYARSVGTKNFLAQSHVLEKAFDTKVFKTTIRRSQSVVDANNNRMSIFDYAPTSNGALDYNAMIDEYLEGVN